MGTPTISSSSSLFTKRKTKFPPTANFQILKSTIHNISSIIQTFNKYTLQNPLIQDLIHTHIKILQLLITNTHYPSTSIPKHTIRIVTDIIPINTIITPPNNNPPTTSPIIPPPNHNKSHSPVVPASIKINNVVPPVKSYAASVTSSTNNVAQADNSSSGHVLDEKSNNVNKTTKPSLNTVTTAIANNNSTSSTIEKNTSKETKMPEISSGPQHIKSILNRMNKNQIAQFPMDLTMKHNAKNSYGYIGSTFFQGKYHVDHPLCISCNFYPADLDYVNYCIDMQADCDIEPVCLDCLNEMVKCPENIHPSYKRKIDPNWRINFFTKYPINKIMLAFYKKS